MTGAIAVLAGAHGDVVLRLAASMLAIQVAIGATNDLVDEPADSSAKPAKPIPSGLVRAPVAQALAVGSLGLGLALAVSVSPIALGLGAAGAAVGFGYDLWLKGTSVSWLPFAIGIPILPLFASWGAVGQVSTSMLVLAGLAVPAGAALAVANALPDLERDAATGMASVATLLGRNSAWRIDLALMVGVASGAAGTFLAFGGSVEGSVVSIVAGLASLGLLAVGVALSAQAAVAQRQRGWELQAVALGALAAAWLGAIASSGRL